MFEYKVSVIIPTYKRAKDICRAVDSVLNQTIDSFECIVVDDNGVGTPEGENTASVMSRYTGDPRVNYIRHDVNKNGSAARNTGIRASKGEFISFLDDDDAYMPSRLEKMYNKLHGLDNSWGACYTGYVKHQPNGRDQLSAEKQEGDLFVKALMRSLYIGTGSNLFFRRESIDRVGLFNESFKRNQDLEYLIRVLKLYKIAYVDEVLMEAFYDIRTSHLTFDQSREREQYFRNCFQQYMEGLSESQCKSIMIMYEIDWIRNCIGYKEYGESLKAIRKAKIPAIVYFKYVKYLYDRWKNNISYGFDVNL